MTRLEMQPPLIRVAQKADTPTSILQSIFDNDAVVRELVTDRPGKASILEEAGKQINSLELQEKIIFLEKTFAIISDPHPVYQNKRDAALELLNIMDLKSIDPKLLVTTYVKAVSDLRENLSEDSDPYGEIHMLLEAGKTIAPFIKNSQRVTQVWKYVANTFPKYEENGDDGQDRQKILNDIKAIRQIILRKFSEFDTMVLKLAETGLQNPDIAAELGVKLIDVNQAIERLRNKGLGFSRKGGKTPSNDTIKLPDLP